MRKALILLVMLFGCDVEPAVPILVLYIPPESPSTQNSYCGDDICDIDNGETYFGCLDCVDSATGLPTNSYCGDGFCDIRMETMGSCWTDCRPRPFNSNPEIGPGPGHPNPGPY